MKDFIDYDGIYMLYKPTSRPSKYIFLLYQLLLDKKWKKYLLMCFESSKFHDIKKWKSTR